jgi:hypothetical protein
MTAGPSPVPDRAAVDGGQISALLLPPICLHRKGKERKGDAVWHMSFVLVTTATKGARAGNSYISGSMSVIFHKSALECYSLTKREKKKENKRKRME